MAGNSDGFVAMPARRYLLAAAAACGAFAAGSGDVRAGLSVAETDATRTFLHQENEFPVTPQRIYDILLHSKSFGAFSHEPAQIDPVAGGAFSLFGARIVGRNIELVPGRRIVQAWRPAHWASGVYSVAKFELVGDGRGTKVILDHTGIPQGDFASLSSGWDEHYWQRLKKYLM
jgi:activator of HSP90 ATPase